MSYGDIFRLAVIGEGGSGQELVNVFHYQQDSLLTVGEAGVDLARGWESAVMPDFLNTFSPGGAIHMLQIRGVTDPTYGYDYDISGHPVGTGPGGDDLPPQVSAVITWKTGLIGRSFNGRTFCWPAGEAGQNRGNISSAYATYLSDFADAAMAFGPGVLYGSWKMGVLSQYHAGEKRETPVFTPITQAVVRTVLCGQRRRRAGVGA